MDAVVRDRFLGGESLPLWKFDVGEAIEEVPDGQCLVWFEGEDDDDDLLADVAPSLDVVAKAIANMYLGACDGGVVQAEPCISLFDLLLKLGATLAGHERRRHALPQNAFVTVEGSQDYCGRAHVCTCGEPACSSEFAWKQDGAVLLHFSMSGMGLREALLLPELLSRPDPVYPGR